MNLFPKPLIGLDISDHSVEALLVARKGETCVVESYGRITLRPGLVVDGEIADAAGLAQAVRKLLRDGMSPALPKGADRVAFALPESQVFMHVFEVPRQADPQALDASLALEADGYFPYPHQELSAGYTVISQRPGKNELYYAAVRTSVLDAYRDLFEDVGLTPVSIEAESTAVARAVLDRDERDPAVLVDVGARVTEISVFDREGIHFSETIDTAGDAFTLALTEAGGLTPEQAEKTKREEGILGAPRAKGDRALRAAVERLLDEVEEAIVFYEGKYHRAAGKILFCGGSAMLPGLMERANDRLGAASGRTVALADPWKSAHPSPKLEALGVRKRSVLIATAVGLGLRGSRVGKFPAINFLAAAPAPRGHQVPLETGTKTSERAPASSTLKLAGGLLAVLLLTAGAWLAVPVVADWLHPSDAPSAGPALPAEISVRASASLAEAGGKPIDLAFSETETFTHAATPTDAKATGAIEIVNTTKAARTLVATTRFLSPEGVLFRLDRTTSIPAGGRVSAAVTADQPGAQGDLAPASFTIPGLSEPVQKQIYGESKAPMHGGVTYAGTPYTEADRAQAIATFQAKATLDVLAQASVQAGDGRLVPPGLVALDPLDIQGLPTVGTPTGDYALQADLRAKAYSLDKNLIERSLGKGLVGDYIIGNPTVTVASFDAAAGTASLELTATAKRR